MSVEIGGGLGLRYGEIHGCYVCSEECAMKACLTGKDGKLTFHKEKKKKNHF